MQSNHTFQFVGDPYHKENLSGRVTAACINCRRKKIKCGGGRECKACREKDLVCEGPSFRKGGSGDAATIVPDSDEVPGMCPTSPLDNAVAESQDAKYDTIQQLLKSTKPRLGRGSPELDLKSASHYVPTTSALSGAEDVGARPSRLVYPLPYRHPPHQGIATALELRLEDDEAQSHRSPGHLIQEAQGLEERAGVLRQLASLQIHDDAMRVRNEVQRHQEQRQYHHHILPRPASQQPRSHPSNPNQAAFGCVVAPASMVSAGPGLGPSRYQFDASTIFRPDGVTLRTGLTPRGGEFGTWDVDNMRPLSIPHSVEQRHQQHRLDFSTPPSHSGSTASSSSTTGFRRMQAALHTQLEAQRSSDDKGEGRFRAYHPPQ
ncbi:hypothetical protein LTR56_002516 [Elasticomyces elasticus]|nr:hypothetical protein LTR22_020211 [Elasticomyces elasticus]KAK3657374.1 hypothetical protein LTR56_002516 [Elasticomyces elasticus]KAK4933547.1 hypothetical protein LTR49_000009 [Elasticomyces elasticus]KAK5754812.1 hypothetical protein LTS12_015129 [Elasticomyces elasticus]